MECFTVNHCYGYCYELVARVIVTNWLPWVLVARFIVIAWLFRILVLTRHYDYRLQVFETSNVQIMADSQYNAQTRIQVLLEYLHEREMDLEDLGEQKRIKLEQCVTLRHFETEARQVTFSNAIVTTITL